MALRKIAERRVGTSVCVYVVKHLTLGRVVIEEKKHNSNIFPRRSS